MGFFDLFSSSPAKKVERAKKVMLNEHQQAQIRQESLLSLVEIGTPEAVSALIERLGVNFRDTIRNEQEKGWVHQFLVDQFKDVSETPLKDFIQTGENVSSAILALKELISDEELTDFLIETLHRYDPKDHRTIEVRLQLIDALDEQEGPVLEAVLPYVLDHDDQIRIKAINLVEDRVKGVDGDHSDVIKTLVEAMTDPYASGRISRAAANALIRLEVNLTDFEAEISDQLPDGYQINKGKLSGQ